MILHMLVPVLSLLFALIPSAAGRQSAGLQPGGQPALRRTALVIGNDAYPRTPLKNAVGDARAVAAALKQYDFEVDLALDVSFKELNKRVDRFIAQIKPGNVALVYYAGHGIQIESENYLVPTDFDAQDEADAKYEGYLASRLADRLSGSGARLSILVLDACRDNPFRTSRSGARGLAAMQTGKGNLIAFATGPNQTADDNPRGANGLFTTYMLEAMQRPGLTVEQVFSWARKKVYEASQGRQTPWLVSSVIGDFYFREPEAPAPRDDDTAMWVAVSESDTAAGFEEYLKKFPAGRYARLATLYLKALKPAEVSPPPAMRPPTISAAPSMPPRPAPSPGGSVSSPVPAVAAAIAPTIQHYFLKAQDNRTNIPFIVSPVPATAVGATGFVAMYYRLESAQPTAKASAGAITNYPFETYQEVDLSAQPPANRALQAAASAPAGEYVLSVALAPTDGTSSRGAIPGLIARVDQRDPEVLRVPITVPEFWNSQFNTSSVMLLNSVDKLETPLTTTQQSTRPFAMGTMELRPNASRRFSTSSELSVMFFIYNAALSKSTGKPDVSVDYTFYARPAGEPERGFNRTAPLLLNAQTLPGGFDPAGYQLAAGNAVWLKTFTPGEYRLQITIQDKVSGERLSREATFTVY